MLMDELRPYPTGTTSRSSFPRKRQKTHSQDSQKDGALVDLITDDRVKNRILYCFEDVIFIHCTSIACHYRKKYARYLDTQDIPIPEFLPHLLMDKIRVVRFINKPSQEYFSLAADPTGQHARALSPNISLQRHCDFQIIRKRLLRLCSSPVDQPVLREMYMHVYGGEPNFPLIDTQEFGQVVKFNGWPELLKAKNVMKCKSLTPLWLDEADRMASQLPVIQKRPLKKWESIGNVERSASFEARLELGHDDPKSHSHTPSFPLMPLYNRKSKEYARFWRHVITSYSDGHRSEQSPLAVAPRRFSHHKTVLTSSWPLNPQISNSNSTLPQPQTLRYQSHLPLFVAPSAPPSTNPSPTLAQPSGTLSSSLHMTRLCIIKLFEDVMYLPVQTILQHYHLKYADKLDFKRFKAKVHTCLAYILPLTLCQIHYRGVGSYYFFALRQSHAPLPAPHPLPVEILRVRVLRLTQSSLRPEILLWLYEHAYGPLHQQQFPVCVGAGGEIVADWVTFIVWTRMERSKEGCRALYATEGKEHEKVPIISTIRQVGEEGWTVFIGSEGKICAEELLRKGEENTVNANMIRVNKKRMSEKMRAKEEMKEEMVKEEMVKEEMMKEEMVKAETVKEEMVAEVMAKTETKVETTEIVTESIVSQTMSRIPPDMITPAQQRMLDVMFFVNWGVSRKRKFE